MTEAHPPHVARPLFFLDYDGTLAPIVDDPKAAAPHPDVPDLLHRLKDRYPVFIVTGRYLKDLDAFLEVPVEAIGLHGMQRGTVGTTAESRVPEAAQNALDALRARVPAMEGMHLEEKGPTFAVHYRHAPDETAARAALKAWTADLPPALTAIWGKKVVELRPEGISKGTAVRTIAEAHPGHTPIYLGDDVTDEDAFAALGGQAVTIKVGEGETVARYRLEAVADVVAYLQGYVAE